MTEVYLHAACQEEFAAGAESLLSTQPLARRMTPLQSALLLAILRLAREHAALLDDLRAINAPLFFSSAYGELGAMLRVIASIIQRDLPVSPKDFQHSVLNAALAYVCMQQGMHQPAFALSGGYASPDTTLQLAARRIASDLDAGALVFHAHEYSALAGGVAKAEILLLAARPCAAGGFRLTRCEHRASLATTRGPGIFSEADTPQQIPWLLAEQRPYRERTLRTLEGTELITHWEERSDGAR